MSPHLSGPVIGPLITQEPSVVAGPAPYIVKSGNRIGAAPVRCRNCRGVLMVISQIRGMNCGDLGDLTALDPRRGG